MTGPDACVANTRAAGVTEALPPPNDRPQLPEPLRRLPLGPWRWMGPGVRVRDVHGPRDGDCRVILLEIKPGCSTPRPRVVSDEPCLCVAALDGQIQLDGWLGKLFQPFVRL